MNQARESILRLGGIGMLVLMVILEIGWSAVRLGWQPSLRALLFEVRNRVVRAFLHTCWPRPLSLMQALHGDERGDKMC